MDTLSSSLESSAIASNNEESSGPVPMSFPGVLRVGLSDNPYAKLVEQAITRGQGQLSGNSVPGKRRRGDNEGRRWVRRKENARFSHNPHIVAASQKDHSIELPTKRSTFPEPLPGYLERNAKIRSSVLPRCNVGTANAGRFGMSIKGARRELRRIGGWGVETIVREVDGEIREWLDEGASDDGGGGEMKFPGRSVIGDMASELERTPLRLVWSIPGNGMIRWVVHLVARWYDVVSFSKDVDIGSGCQQRLTYLLRPNVVRPDPRARWGLETPPTTDIESGYASLVDESDFSDVDVERASLGAIPENDQEPIKGDWSPVHNAHPIAGGADIGRLDFEADADESDIADLADSVGWLDLGPATTQAPKKRPSLGVQRLRGDMRPSFYNYVYG